MGGPTAVTNLVRSLPGDLNASVFVVYHIDHYDAPKFANFISLKSDLPVSYAIDDEPIRKGHVYLARANHHMMLRDGFIKLSGGPRENCTRPAIDPLFRSAAPARSTAGQSFHKDGFRVSSHD